MKPLMAAWAAITHGDHSNQNRVPSPRLILSHRALSLGGYRTYNLIGDVDNDGDLVIGSGWTRSDR